MITEIVDLVIGFILGVITNFVAWGLLFHYFVPKIRFSSQISKVPIKKTREDKSGFRYRFKIENCSSRNIIDIELTARLKVKGLRTPTIWNIFDIPLSPDGSPSIRIPIMSPARKGKIGKRKIMFFYPNSTDILKDWSIFPDVLRNKARNKTLILEDLMKSGIKSELIIYAFCYDSFSGTRKLFISEPYSAHDIVVGSFEPASINILPYSLANIESPEEVSD